MDEIEFLRNYNNLRILIDDLKDEPRIRNAMLVIAALLDGLNQRVMRWDQKRVI